MRTWLGLAMTTVLLGVSVGACSSTPAEKYPTADSMCADVATQECQIASLCGADVAACTAARKDNCVKKIVVPATVGGRTYTPALAQACVDKAQSNYALSNRFITVDQQNAQFETCNRVFQGASSVNSKCMTNYDCAGSNVCTSNICGAKTVKAVMTGCGNPGDVCDTGLFCAPGMPALCQPGKASGAACADSTQCGPNLRCSASVCGARGGSGAACTTNDDCDTTAAYCNTADGSKCSAGLTFPGATCKDYGKP